jgi:paraquat-inducible protein A
MLSMDTAIACLGCDLLVDVHGLRDGERARCPRCGHFLTRVQRDAVSHLFAYALSGLVFLALACSYPFLSFAAAGQESVITLPQTAQELYAHGMHGMALLVAAFIMLIPALVMILLVLLCLPLLRSSHTRWLSGVARWIFTLYNWAMVEVFIIGVIVSLVKLHSMATVTLGISFWAYIAFSLCFVLALATLDRYQCWQQIEQLETGR